MQAYCGSSRFKFLWRSSLAGAKYGLGVHVVVHVLMMFWKELRGWYVLRAGKGKGKKLLHMRLVEKSSHFSTTSS